MIGIVIGFRGFWGLSGFRDFETLSGFRGLYRVCRV